MPLYSYSVLKDKECLTDTDKNRLICVLLACDFSTITSTADWDKATTEFGAKSTESMRVMVRSVLKKIENAGGKLDDQGKTSQPVTPSKRSGAAPKTPKSSNKKRKLALSGPMEWSDDDDEDDKGKVIKEEKQEDGDDTSELSSVHLGTSLDSD